MRPLQAIADEKNESEKKENWMNWISMREYEQLLKQSFVDREWNKCWSKKRDLQTQYSVAVCLWKKRLLDHHICALCILSKWKFIAWDFLSFPHLSSSFNFNFICVCNPRCWKSSIPRFSSHFRTVILFIKETL